MSEQNVRAQDGWLSAIKQLLQILLLVAVIVLVVANWYYLNVFIKRLLNSAVQVSIADFLSVTITSEQGTTRQEKWAAFYRVADRVKVLEASLDDDKTDVEFLDLTAITPINLGGSYIGDANEMLFLGQAEIQLQAGETLRIYTFVGGTPKPEKSPEAAREKLGRRVVIATPLKINEKTKGLFQTHVGEGDRIVVIDREKKVILDLDYWWVQPPAA